MKDSLLINRIHQIIAIIIIIFCLLFIFSCNMQKYCATRFPGQDSTIVTERLIYKDTVIKLPGDTLTFIDILPCPDYDTTVNSERQIIKVVIKDRILTTTGICKEDSLKARISFLEKAVQTVKTITYTEEKTPFWNLVIYGALAVIILFLLIKLIMK